MERRPSREDALREAWGRVMLLENHMERSIELGDRRSHMLLEDDLELERRYLEQLLRTKSDG